MSLEFRAPNLSAQTAEGQIQQLLSFLRQHVQQLNWVLKNLETEEVSAQTQTEEVPAEVFRTICRRLKKKQAQENFLGSKRAILENGSWAQGASAAADLAAVGRYTVFVAVMGGVPVVCAKHGSTIHAEGLTLTCGSTAITVTAAESPVTALYAVA